VHRTKAKQARMIDFSSCVFGRVAASWKSGQQWKLLASQSLLTSGRDRSSGKSGKKTTRQGALL